MEKTNIILLIVINFSIYFLITSIYNKMKIRNVKEALFKENGIVFLNLRHIIGILLFGACFIFLFPEYNELLIELNYELKTLILAIIVMLIVSFGAYLSFKKEVVKIIKKTKLKPIFWIKYIGLRIVFLFSYEFFFRGVLFFTTIEYFGLTFAVLINIILYMFIHLFDDKKEFYGTIPFGIVLCLLTYFSNSIWFAFLIHGAMSCVYEISIIRYLTLKNQKS